MLEVYCEDQVQYGTSGQKQLICWTIQGSCYNGIMILKYMQVFYGEQERFEGQLHTGVGHVIQIIWENNRIFLATPGKGRFFLFLQGFTNVLSN
jgi:hypothetical protein